MKSGAGTGPGLDGPGSQNAGGTSTGDAKPGSGSVTASPSPSSTKNAAGKPNARSVDKEPFAVAGLVILLTLSGALLL
jgi:hypothetical protein